MKLFSQMLIKRLKILGLQNEAFSSLVLEKTNQAIQANVPSHVAEKCVAKTYKNGIISIRCQSVEARNFMRNYSKSFVALLQQEFPKEPITAIVFSL